MKINKRADFSHIVLIFIVLTLILCVSLFVLCACDDSSTSDLPATNTPTEDSPSTENPDLLEHQHSYSPNVTQEPTCTEVGTLTYTCDCSDSYTEEISVTEHALQLAYDDDSHWQKCANCNYVCDKTVHDVVEQTITELTCTQDEVVQFTCECGYSHVETVYATGHDYDYSTILRYTAEGHFYGCAKCDSQLMVQHDFETTRHEPSCTDVGWETISCECGLSETQPVDELGHDFVTVELTEATCEDVGSIEQQCKRCDEQRSQPIAALGHNAQYVEAKPATDVDGNIAYWQCQRCNRYFSSQSCEQKLTEDDIIIRVPKTNVVATIAELEAIAYANFTDAPSEEYYQITLTVLTLDTLNRRLLLGDTNDDFILVYFDLANDLNAIFTGSVVTIKGQLCVENDRVTLLNAKIV